MARPQAHLLSVVSTAVLLLSSACDDQTPNTQAGRRPGSSALLDEPSPNASILPDPLARTKERDPASRSGVEAGLTHEPVVVPRPKPVPFAENEALIEDSLVRGGTGQGYRAHARFVWSSSQSTVIHSGEKTVTWPEFQIDLLRELPDLPARLRLVLDSPVFSLTKGTEIRMRADRIGFVIVWPDQRSYRQLPPGTMSALFSDRRADRLPFLDETLKVLDGTPRAGRAVIRHSIETSMGSAEMEFTERADLPYAAPLLCQLLLDMVRVSATPELCPEGKLPIRFSMLWTSGGGFLLEILNYNVEPLLNFDELRMPPSLPIYKRGELPPANDYFLPANLRDEVFSLKRIGEPLAPRPVPIASAASTPNQARQASEGEQLASDEVTIENTTDRPLTVFLDRLPFVWLPAGEKKNLRVRGAPVVYAARDFWGHVQLEPGLIAAPASVIFGPPPTANPIGN